MKAVVMTAAGGPEVLEFRDIPEPEILSDTQIKVQVKAAGVNPVDTKLRSRGVFYPDALPAVLGCDGAGVVVDSGAAVKRFREGDAVWFCNGGLGGDQGNYAEYTVVEESVAQSKPVSLSFDEAAAAPLVLITAWESLHDRTRLGMGKTVLVHAGAGGVGHVAIQLAKFADCPVCTTVGSEEKAEFVKSLGADEAIRYREQDFVEAVKHWTSGAGVDIALDTIGGRTFARTLAAMAFYGDLVTILAPGPDIDWQEARRRNLRIAFELMLTPMLEALPDARLHHGEILEYCARLFEKQEMRIHVSHRFPLEDAAEAHRLVEEGHVTGKVALII
ncbi:MAG: zinc-dependent alcohol dehydrogenase family protein [Gammaproteobacteria bacterium]|jgi:NADPH2:quinone reductase|nr:zinc-dependent alcohol dehydrogenase family protein [Gammaproteobacteria bacterium]